MLLQAAGARREGSARVVSNDGCMCSETDVLGRLRARRRTRSACGSRARDKEGRAHLGRDEERLPADGADDVHLRSVPARVERQPGGLELQEREERRGRGRTPPSARSGPSWPPWRCARASAVPLRRCPAGRRGDVSRVRCAWMAAATGCAEARGNRARRRGLSRACGAAEAAHLVP